MADPSWDKLPLPPKLSGAPDELREAIANLEETIVEKDLSPIGRMIDLGRRFVSACFKKKDCANHTENTQERLINAISVIKAHYLQGNYSEKKATKSAIEPKVRCNVSTPSSSKVARLKAPWRDVSIGICQATPRELDLFRVKAISLIRKYVTQNTLLQEALDAIRNTPIVQSPSQDNHESGTITLTQTIQLFPDCFVLQGSFQRNAHSKVTSIPLSGSFHVVNNSQSGHPQPKLHNGWALSEHLLPTLAESRTATPILFALLTKKQQIADALQGGGTMVHKAKQLIANKQRVFQNDLPKHIRLHQALTMQIATSSGATLLLAPIQNYYSWLATQSNAYDQISQLYEILNDVFLGHATSQPADHKERQKEWLEGQADHPATHFIAYLGPILAKGREEQETLFGRQLLHALYRQLWSFHNALDCELTADTLASQMTESLIADRLCFETDPLQNIVTIPQRAVAEHLF